MVKFSKNKMPNNLSILFLRKMSFDNIYLELNAIQILIVYQFLINIFRNPHNIFLRNRSETNGDNLNLCILRGECYGRSLKPRQRTITF